MYFDLMNFHILNPLQPLSKAPGTAVHGNCQLHNTRAEIGKARNMSPGTTRKERARCSSRLHQEKKKFIFCQNGVCIAKEKCAHEIR